MFDRPDPPDCGAVLEIADRIRDAGYTVDVIYYTASLKGCWALKVSYKNRSRWFIVTPIADQGGIFELSVLSMHQSHRPLLNVDFSHVDMRTKDLRFLDKGPAAISGVFWLLPQRIVAA